jgi:hypothetical protein
MLPQANPVGRVTLQATSFAGSNVLVEPKDTGIGSSSSGKGEADIGLFFTAFVHFSLEDIQSRWRFLCSVATLTWGQSMPLKVNVTVWVYCKMSGRSEPSVV